MKCQHATFKQCLSFADCSLNTVTRREACANVGGAKVMSLSVSVVGTENECSANFGYIRQATCNAQNNRERKKQKEGMCFTAKPAELVILTLA